MPSPDNRQSINRRQFVQRAAAGGAAFSILKSETVHGYGANSKIKLGLIGCGGRGTWIAELFKKHGGYEIVGAADYFSDRAESFGTRIGVDASRRYTGLAAYKRLLDAKVDAVAIESPPCFHPYQAAAAVDAGVHVYLAKPIAVDVPGCTLVADSAKRAAANRRVFLVDFQTRVTPSSRKPSGGCTKGRSATSPSQRRPTTPTIRSKHSTSTWTPTPTTPKTGSAPGAWIAQSRETSSPNRTSTRWMSLPGS